MGDTRRNLSVLFPTLLAEPKLEKHLKVSASRWAAWQDGSLSWRQQIPKGSRGYFNVLMKAEYVDDSTAAAALHTLAIIDHGLAALKKNGISVKSFLQRMSEVESEYYTCLFELRVASAIANASEGGQLVSEVPSQNGSMNVDFGLSDGTSTVLFEVKWRDDFAFGSVAPHFYEALLAASIRARDVSGVPCGFNVHVASNAPNAKDLEGLDEYFKAAIEASDPNAIGAALRPVLIRRRGAEERAWIPAGKCRLMFPVDSGALVRWIEADRRGSGIFVGSAGDTRHTQREGWPEAEKGDKPPHADAISNLIGKAGKQIGDKLPGAIVVGFDDEDSLDELHQALFDVTGLFTSNEITPNVAVIGVAQEPISVYGTYRSSAVRVFGHPASSIPDPALAKINAVARTLAEPFDFPSWR